MQYMSCVCGCQPQCQTLNDHTYRRVCPHCGEIDVTGQTAHQADLLWNLACLDAYEEQEHIRRNYHHSA